MLPRVSVSQNVVSLANQRVVGLLPRTGVSMLSLVPFCFALSSMALTGQEQQSGATDVFQRNSTAVVTISTDTGFGSGVLIDPTGVVVTNLHVVRGTTKASIRLSTGDVYEQSPRALSARCVIAGTATGLFRQPRRFLQAVAAVDCLMPTGV